jgi:hypothetical protein
MATEFLLNRAIKKISCQDGISNGDPTDPLKIRRGLREDKRDGGPVFTATLNTGDPNGLLKACPLNDFAASDIHHGPKHECADRPFHFVLDGLRLGRTKRSRPSASRTLKTVMNDALGRTKAR